MKAVLSRAILNALAEEFHFTLDVPFESYSKEIHEYFDTWN